MYLTYFGGNGWLIDWDGLRILVDPWLVGSLVFGKMDWLFKGDRPQPIETLPESIDLILLSQGLDDHAHRPTLEQLDRTIPVVGSPNAAKVVEQLGYQTVTALSPGKSWILHDRIEIHAISGAPVGLQPENGYVLKHLHQGTSLYYEPHGFPPANIQDFAPLDVVISPVVNLELPLVGPLIKGQTTAPELVALLKPKAFLPTAVGGDVVYEGLLLSMLRTVGDIEQFRALLASQGLQTDVFDPQLQQPIELRLEPSLR